MAIKVGGTSVINDSRVLENVTGLKTINSTSILGSGNISAGASTTAGAVGTYTYGRPKNTTNYDQGDTATGIYPVCETSNNNPTVDSSNNFYNAHAGTIQSGTWRCMSEARASSGYVGNIGLWVRIS